MFSSCLALDPVRLYFWQSSTGRAPYIAPYANYNKIDIWVEFIQWYHMSLYSLNTDANLSLEFWESLTEPSLFTKSRELSVSGLDSGYSMYNPCHMSLQDESAAAFWKACTRFKAMTLRDLFLTPLDMDCCLTFKVLKSLELTRVEKLTIADYMTLFSNCPWLQHLHWEHNRVNTCYMNHEILEGMAQLALSGTPIKSPVLGPGSAL